MSKYPTPHNQPYLIAHVLCSGDTRYFYYITIPYPYEYYIRLRYLQNSEPSIKYLWRIQRGTTCWQGDMCRALITINL